MTKLMYPSSNYQERNKARWRGVSDAGHGSSPLSLNPSPSTFSKMSFTILLDTNISPEYQVSRIYHVPSFEKSSCLAYFLLSVIFTRLPPKWFYHHTGMCFQHPQELKSLNAARTQRALRSRGILSLLYKVGGCSVSNRWRQ